MTVPAFTKQGDEPLFPNVFWNRPTMRARAGRLLLIGGHKNAFGQLQSIYQGAEAAGIGECVVAMPDSLRRTVGDAGFGRFMPASASGSLGKAALADLLELATDADALIIGGNLTNNAETAVVIESLVTRLEQPVVITEETIEILKFHPELITGNPQALVVATMSGLFALANHHHMPIAIKPESGVICKIEIMQQLAAISRCAYLIFDGDIMVQTAHKTSLTVAAHDLTLFTGTVTGAAATFWIQQQSQIFEALTSVAFVLAQAVADNPSSEIAMSKNVATMLDRLSH